MSRKPAVTSAISVLALIVAALALRGGSQATGAQRVADTAAYLRNASVGSGPSVSQAVTYQIFTVSGSFSVPSGVNRMIIEARGAGGGGGAGANGGIGGGGGQGGWVRVLVKVKAGATYRVTIGQGGVGGSQGIANGQGNTGGSTTVRPRGKSVVTAEATGGEGGLIGESCAFDVGNGPVAGGIGGSVLSPTDTASTGLEAARGPDGGSSGYLGPSCPSAPIGGFGGGRGFFGAGGAGGASPANGHDGHAGLVIVTFLS
jgi:hypothetical protein